MSNVIPGGWKIEDMAAVSLPEEAATAFSEVTKSLVGAKYVPVLFCGTQVVQGVNYMIICKQTIVNKDAAEHIVEMIINSFEQGYSIVEINKII